MSVHHERKGMADQDNLHCGSWEVKTGIEQGTKTRYNL